MSRFASICEKMKQNNKRNGRILVGGRGKIAEVWALEHSSVIRPNQIPTPHHPLCFIPMHRAVSRFLFLVLFMNSSDNSQLNKIASAASQVYVYGNPRKLLGNI
jgi:hypothetical protein